MSSTAFFEPLPVIDFVAQLLNRDISIRPLSDADRVKIKKALRGVKVEVTHRGNMRRKYRISGLTAHATRELSFPIDDHGTVKTVVQYFQETYGFNIQHTTLKCQVCKIAEGQRYSKRLNEKQIAALLKVTCQRPQERELDILQIYNEQITDLLQPAQKNLQIREDVRTACVYVESLTKEFVFTMKDVTQLLVKGLANRRTGSTSANADSSRSHCVFTCVIKSESKDELHRMKSNGGSEGSNGSFSNGWNARRSLHLLKMSLTRPTTFQAIKEDSDEEMEIDEDDVEKPYNHQNMDLLDGSISRGIYRSMRSLGASG